MVPRLNLVVIRSRQMEESVAFYEALGMLFTKHAHGKGAEHYAAESIGFTFEIYPEDSPGSTTSTRLGFQVTGLDELLSNLTQRGGQIVSPAKPSPWGRRAVITDPSGHKIELCES